jgi:hypothetical protein
MCLLCHKQLVLAMCADLCRAVPAAILGLRLGATSKELVAALLPLTTHKRYRVRIAAIEAIRDVMHQVRLLATAGCHPCQTQLSVPSASAL